MSSISSPDLFPGNILGRFGQAGAPTDRGHHSGPPGPPDRAAEQREVGARVGGWLQGDAAALQTAQGRVSPEWRQVERELGQSFQPPVEVVHQLSDKRNARVGDALRTFAQQVIGVAKRGEAGVRREVIPGSHDVGTAIDPSLQGFPGAPEGLNLRSLPLQQQFAAQAAMGDPVSWQVCEIEVALDGERRVTRAEVVTPSGRRRFDRYALAAVQERVAAGGEAGSTSRWRVSAGYSVAPPTALGMVFDADMLADKKLRRQAALQYPFKRTVQSRVMLVWTRRDQRQ